MEYWNDGRLERKNGMMEEWNIGMMEDWKLKIGNWKLEIGNFEITPFF
jgi:hypothetical protein